MAFFQTRPRGQTEPAAQSTIARKVVVFLGSLVPAFGFFMFFGLNLSPWLGDRMDLLFDGTVRVEASVTSCEPVRNGVIRENTIRCAFSYSYQGKTFQSQGIAWRSQSPFTTDAALHRVLAEQSAINLRPADIRPRRPDNARLADQRLLATPPLWFWLMGVLAALLAAVVYLDPPVTIYRRADLEVDPATGHLMDTNNKRRNRMRWLDALKALTALAFVLACLYGLSNRPANALQKMGLSNLQPVPAQLVDCASHRRGGYRGHDQIECAFDYVFNGQTLRGQAESLDFRYFPTKARIAAEVAKLQTPQASAITAYVDPQHPGFAWAFISNDWWVDFAWGIWELELWVALVVAAGFLFWPLSHRWQGRRDLPRKPWRGA